MKPEDQQSNYWQPPEDEATPETPMEQAPAADDPESRQLTTSDSTVSWTAQEYVHFDKGPLWFVVFVIVVLALVAADVFVLRSWTFSLLVIVAAITLLIYLRRPPRTLSYGLTSQGLNVGDKLYHFEDFKAFGVLQEGGHNSIMLIPRRRFAPGVSVFFPEEAGEKIVDILGQRLPMQDVRLDVIDTVVRWLRL